MSRWWGAIAGCLCLPGCVIVQVSATNPLPGLSTVAVVPFFNLSAEPERVADGRRVALAYFAELQKTPGFQVIPVGVAEQAIREHHLEMNDPADALQLCRILNCDAVVVGAITDYDPYFPPRLGLQVAWYSPYPWVFQPGIPIDPCARCAVRAGDEAARREEVGRGASEVSARAKAGVRSILPGKCDRCPSCEECPCESAPAGTASGAETSRPTNGRPAAQTRPYRPAGTIRGQSEGPSSRANRPARLPEAVVPRRAPADTESLPDLFHSAGPASVPLGSASLADLAQPDRPPGDELTRRTAMTQSAPDGVPPPENVPPPFASEAAPRPSGLPVDGPAAGLPIADGSGFPPFDPRQPFMAYTRMFDARDAAVMASLRDWLELAGDRRSGGWQAPLARSEDFLRFCSQRMIIEMLTLHGGEARRRVVFKLRHYREP